MSAAWRFASFVLLAVAGGKVRFPTFAAMVNDGFPSIFCETTTKVASVLFFWAWLFNALTGFLLMDVKDASKKPVGSEGGALARALGGDEVVGGGALQGEVWEIAGFSTRCGPDAFEAAGNFGCKFWERVFREFEWCSG